MPSNDRTRTLRAADHASIWHPFTPMSEWLEDDAPVIERAEGVELIDTDGDRYIDGVSSLWVNVHGHGIPDRRRDRRADTTAPALDAPRPDPPPAIELAERLIAIAPGRLSRVFFSDDGAAAVEVALKMAFQYWRNRGETRPVLSLENGYHGDTLGDVSVGGVDRFHEMFRPLLFPALRGPSPHCYRCPLGLERPRAGSPAGRGRRLLERTTPARSPP